MRKSWKKILTGVMALSLAAWSVPAYAAAEEMGTEGNEIPGGVMEETELSEEAGDIKEEETADGEIAAVEGEAGEDGLADNIIASGKSGDITWVIDADGKLTANGTGDFEPYIPWLQCPEQVISAEINVTGMTDASWMFYGCENLVNVDLSGFDTENVKNMQWMFVGCNSLESLDLSGFKTGNVESMYVMFAGCESLSNLDLSGFDTKNVKSMYGMFDSCSKLKELNISNFDFSNIDLLNDSPDPEAEWGLFYGCDSLCILHTPKNMGSFNAELPGTYFDPSGRQTDELNASFTNTILTRVGSGMPIPTEEPAATESPSPTTAPTEAPNPTTAPTTTPVPGGTPFIQDDPGKNGWEAILNEIVNAGEGKWIMINMNGISTVPGNVFDNAKGKNVILAFDMGNGVIWYVNGKDITSGYADNVDLFIQVGVSNIPQDILAAVAGTRHTIQLSFGHRGDFGYNAALAVNAGSANAGLYVNLFHYNAGAGKLEYIRAGKIEENGDTKLPFTYGSDYVIVVDEKDMGADFGDDPNDTPSADDSTEEDTDSGDSQEPSARAPKTGEDDSLIGGYQIADGQSEGNGVSFVWVVLIGLGALAATGAIAFLIWKKEK